MGVHSGTAQVLELIMGPVDAEDPPIGPEIWVNPAQSPPAGWGDFNLQQFQSGHVNNLVTNPAAEQGYGVGPERQWGHYPHTTNPNPYRRLAALQRDGGDSYSTLVYRPEVVAYWANALRHQAGAGAVKVPMRPDPVVNQHPTQPYVATVAPIMPGGH